MINIGPLQFKNPPICLAPMEDVSDAPFRLMCRRMGADIVYTEFTCSEAIIRDIPRALRKITVSEEERPVAIQIFGGVEESMEEAAKITESFNPDFIDINCGCWVKNHVARGQGAALLKDLKKFESIVKATVNATKLPVTVKTRLGWDKENIVILEVAKMCEQVGVKALALHCRVRAQAHDGDADWSWLAKVKKVVSIPVFGNGDVKSPLDAKAMLETGCDGVMIGRGAIGNPWIFKQTQHYLKTGELLPAPSIRERFETCIEHLKLSVQFRGEKYGISPFRKYYAGYFKGIPHITQMRNEIMQMVELAPIEDRLNKFLEENEHESRDSAYFFEINTLKGQN